MGGYIKQSICADGKSEILLGEMAQNIFFPEEGKVFTYNTHPTVTKFTNPLSYKAMKFSWFFGKVLIYW